MWASICRKARFQFFGGVYTPESGIAGSNGDYVLLSEEPSSALEWSKSLFPLRLEHAGDPESAEPGLLSHLEPVPWRPCLLGVEGQEE